MRFAIIDPLSWRHPEPLGLVCKDLDAAAQFAGTGQVDHGTIRRGLGIAVPEFGLFDTSNPHTYFAIDEALFAGPAVLYAYDESGATIDISMPLPRVVLFDSVAEIEDAIGTGKVRRPQMIVNGEVVWSWNQREKET